MRLPILVPLVPFLFLSACSLHDRQELPKPEMPPAFRNAAVLKAEKGRTSPAEAPPGLPKPLSEWWREFGSEELNTLVARVLANNHDLKAAIHRIAQAEAQAGVAASSLLPSLQFGGKVQTDAPIGGPGARDSYSNGHGERSHQFGLTASYELDLWGKNRWTEENALDNARASIFDREVVALTLVADTVTTFFQYLQAQDRITVTERSIENMTNVLDVVKKRKRIGEGTDVEIEQQKTALFQARAQLAPLVRTREQSLNRLGVLLGEPPGTYRPAGTGMEVLRMPEVPEALPSQLLESRPDIRKAEANLSAADANIGVARAQRLPTFSITGEHGLASAFWATLFQPKAFYYLIAGNAAATLFDNGKISSQIDYSRAVYAERMESYRQSILNALRDVEDALVSVRQTALQEAAQTEAWASAANAYRLSKVAFHIGTADYLTLLETERTQYQTEDAKVQARFDRLSAMVTLFRGLGGGFDAGKGEGEKAKVEPVSDGWFPERKPQPPAIGNAAWSATG
ncbi:MAG: efflux transporter outer membrane subunit [Alphaproteobacteria bacterium]